MRIAMIGTGWVAGEHLRSMQDFDEIEVAAHVSPTQAHREQAAQAWGGTAYPDTAAMLASEQIDAAWVCVPPHRHGEIERQLLAHAIPMMIEKPLSADRVTAADLAEEIAQAGVITAVGYHWRALDTLAQVRARLVQNPAHMVIGRWHGDTPPPQWWRLQAESGGQMVEQATHLVDLARHLLGEATVRAAFGARHPRPGFPDADVDDVSGAMLDFASGTKGVFTATCLLPGGDSVQLELIGEGLLVTITQGEITVFDESGRQTVSVQQSPFTIENRAFITAIQSGNPSHLLCDYADALKTHHLCHDILDASRL